MSIFTGMGEKSKTEDSLYTYRATVTSVYDGDTITCTISLGFDIELKDQKIRLLGINAPEVRGEQRESGLVTRDRLREKIDGKQVLLKTKKRQVWTLARHHMARRGRRESVVADRRFGQGV